MVASYNVYDEGERARSGQSAGFSKDPDFDRVRVRRPKFTTYQRLLEPQRNWVMFDENGNTTTVQREKQVL